MVPSRVRNDHATRSNHDHSLGDAVRYIWRFRGGPIDGVVEGGGRPAPLEIRFPGGAYHRISEEQGSSRDGVAFDPVVAVYEWGKWSEI